MRKPKKHPSGRDRVVVPFVLADKSDPDIAAYLGEDAQRLALVAVLREVSAAGLTVQYMEVQADGKIVLEVRTGAQQ